MTVKLKVQSHINHSENYRQYLDTLRKDWKENAVGE